jgi:hypothetical protein
MGFDLEAKRLELGEKMGYLGANIYSMILLRSAMLAAGVNEKLIYKKFIANDGFLVTPIQAKTIAQKLNAWLKGRKLVIDVAEQNENVRRINNVTLKLVGAFGTRGQKSAAAHLRREKSIPITLDREMRKTIRNFARFCERSGGFWVD